MSNLYTYWTECENCGLVRLGEPFADINHGLKHRLKHLFMASVEMEMIKQSEAERRLRQLGYDPAKWANEKDEEIYWHFNEDPQ